MIFKMKSQDLLEGVNIVTRALAARPAKQILEGVLISAASERVRFTCSDGAMTIDYQNAADIEEEGQIVLPGRLFAELIRKMPEGDIQVSSTDNRTAVIRCQKNRSSLSVMNAMEYPEMTRFSTGSMIKIPQKSLKNMINRSSFAIATDESRQILTGCLLEVSRSEARLVALDGFRLALQKLFQPFELPQGVDLVKAVIPGKIVNELSRILQDDDSFCNLLIDKGRLKCSFNNITVTGVLLAGEFIDYRRIIPSEFKTEVIADRNQVEEALDRASLMAREGKNNLVKMSFRENQLTIFSNAEMGNVKETVDVSLTGEVIDIAFNAKYMMDVIRNVSEDHLCLKMNTSVSPCVIYPQETDDYLYLILPVRVFQ